MDTILVILGVLGLGAIVIAAYVFTVAARNYVSDDMHSPYYPQPPMEAGRFIIRAPRDRRRGVTRQFPITVNSELVTRDRRVSDERRAIA